MWRCTQSPVGAIIVVVLGLAACGDVGVNRVTAPVAAPIERPLRRHVSAQVESDATDVALHAAPTFTIDVPTAVATLRDRTVDDLVAMLDTTNGRFRRDAIYELVRRGPPESTFETLIELQSDDDAWTAAAHALACFRDPALRELRARLAALAAPESESGDESEDIGDRVIDLEFAIEEIEWLFPSVDTREASSAPAPPAPSIETLRRWLSDSIPEFRRSAAVDAARLGAGDLGAEVQVLVPAIVAALVSDDVVDPDVIAGALRELGAEHHALLVIRPRMAQASVGDLREWVQALGELGPIACDDVATHAPRLLAEGGELGRVDAFAALRATEADVTAFRDAIAESLRRFARDRSAAAMLLAANPELALEMREELVSALPDGELNGGRRVVAALLATGGLPPDDALRLLDTVERSRVSRILEAVGPATARPGDDVALRLWAIALEDESESRAEEALEALERAEAIDAHDVRRLMDVVECRELGTYLLAELTPASPSALPRLLAMLERGDDVAWPLAMLGPRAAAALPRLVLEARDQDAEAAGAVGAIGVAGVEPLRRALDGQHAVLHEAVLLEVLWGIRETAEHRTDSEVDAACRGYLALLVDVAPEHLDARLQALTVHDDCDVRWAAERLR